LNQLVADAAAVLQLPLPLEASLENAVQYAESDWDYLCRVLSHAQLLHHVTWPIGEPPALWVYPPDFYAGLLYLPFDADAKRFDRPAIHAVSTSQAFVVSPGFVLWDSVTLQRDSLDSAEVSVLPEAALMMRARLLSGLSLRLGGNVLHLPLSQQAVLAGKPLSARVASVLLCLRNSDGHHEGALAAPLPLAALGVTDPALSARLSASLSQSMLDGFAVLSLSPLAAMPDRALPSRDNPDDGRAQLLCLSPAGTKKVPVLAAIADANDAEFFGVIAGEERAQLERLTRRLVDLRGLAGVPID
jgi:hypothetical protein